jgi:hypothetical protein
VPLRSTAQGRLSGASLIERFETCVFAVEDDSIRTVGEFATEAALEAVGAAGVAASSERRLHAGGRRQLTKYAAAKRAPEEEERVARADNRRGIAGISLGGIIVIVGIVLMFVWSFWIGLIIALVGLIAFGGFARGKWY